MTKHLTLPASRLSGSISDIASRLFLGLIFFIPLLYLLIDPTYFNKDDNFSQFTPALEYAIQALLHGQFPWISPADFTVRLAEAPYYAIFSPIMLTAGLAQHLLHLPSFWLMNIWAVAHLWLITWVLVRFTSNLDLPWHLRSAVVLSAGVASYFALWSASWYYTLPYHLLLVTKVMYWHQAISDKPRSDAVHICITFLAVLGGNPQFLLYTLIAEFLIAAPNMTRRLFTLYIRNTLITGLLMAPLFYCHLRYWSNGWRTIEIYNTVDVLRFLRIGLINPLMNEGPSMWILLCIFALAITPWRKMPNFVASLASSSVLMLALSTFDPRVMNLSWLNYLTVPMKWWLFGGVLAVATVAVYAQCWTRSRQKTLSAFAWATAVLYLFHYFGDTPFSWEHDDYASAAKSAEIIKMYADGNSRTLQQSSDRPRGSTPSRHLILNTWLTTGAVMTTGYESLQPAESTQRKTSVNPPTLQALGVGAIWVNKDEFPSANFDVDSFDVAYDDSRNMFLRLKEPGEIVTCALECSPNLTYYPDRIDVQLDRAVHGPIEVKVNPLAGFVITPPPRNDLRKSNDGWLIFEADGLTAFSLKYQDNTFIYTLILSYCTAIIAFAFFLSKSTR